MATNNTIKIEGAKELRKAIKRTQDKELIKALKKSNKDAAEIVADEAKTTVPVRSGALRKSIRALGSQTKGQVAAGRGKTNAYAGIIHFGNPRHNIEPQPFLYEAQDKRVNEVRDAYEKSLKKLIDDVSTNTK